MGGETDKKGTVPGVREQTVQKVTVKCVDTGCFEEDAETNSLVKLCSVH